jgi:riboflavin kinase/FMN adenylyltransferase
MHQGHLAVLDTLVKEAKNAKLESVVVSFVAGKNRNEKQVLTTEEEKAYFAQQAGVDAFLTYEIEEIGTFSHRMLTKLFNQLGVEMVVMGESNSHLKELQSVCEKHEIQVVLVAPVMEDGKEVSTKRVRTALMEGRFDKGTALLGHPYIIIGVVEHGKALGRTVGMPTANLGVDNRKWKPPSGVYATWSEIQGVKFKGVTNIGTRPSIDDLSHITIETHLLNFSRDIYDMKIRLEVYFYIRGVRKFQSLSEVQQQVQKDLEQVNRL